jgi:hypothetical protein
VNAGPVPTDPVWAPLVRQYPLGLQAHPAWVSLVPSRGWLLTVDEAVDRDPALELAGSARVVDLGIARHVESLKGNLAFQSTEAYTLFLWGKCLCKSVGARL